MRQQAGFAARPAGPAGLQVMHVAKHHAKPTPLETIPANPISGLEVVRTEFQAE